MFEYAHADDEETIIVSRAKFEELCKDLFVASIELIRGALAAADLQKTDIDEVVLVGGSTRIPKINEMVTEFFDNKPLNTTIDPDHAVALGATWECARLLGLTGGCDVAITDIVN